MRTAIICPYSSGPMRGNITTIRRITRYLGQAGVETLMLAADTVTTDRMKQQLDDFSPDLIHGFHAFFCGDIARQLALQRQIPFVITVTGSDIRDPHLRSQTATLRTLAEAAVIVCFDRSDAVEVEANFAQAAGRIAIIPQGVEPLPVSGNDDFGIPADAFVALLPAALRPVKNIDFCIRAMKPLFEQDNRLRLVIAGGVIDQGYAADITAMLVGVPQAVWLGEVAWERMGDLYRRADLVLNCSSFEAMPNSLLEAMALGRPVLAADIPGNRSLVSHGRTGWLYGSEAEFRKQVLQLVADDILRSECGNQAREHVLKCCSPGREAELYLAVYRSCSGRI